MPFQDDFNKAADEWYSLEAGSFPAVPRPVLAVRETVPLVISDTPGFRARPDIIKAALLVLSQSPTARQFSAVAAAAGYRIVVDPPSLSAAGREDALGNTDHEGKTINLRGCDDPLRLALIMAHELAHVSQIVQGGLDMQARNLHPLAALRQLLAMEGDARAHELLIAAELSFRSGNDPEERLLFPEILSIAAETIGASFATKIIDAATPSLRAGSDPAPAMAEIFRGFYGSPGLRTHYEETILRTLEGLETECPGILQEPELFAKDLPKEKLIRQLAGHGHAYLTVAGEIPADLDDSFLLGVSAATQKRLAALEALRHQNPATADQKSWQGEVYRIENPVPAGKPAAPPKPPAF